MDSKQTLRAAALVVLALWAAPAPAADPPAAAPAPSPPAQLQIGGRTIVTFRASVGGYTPADRAQGARMRLLTTYESNPRLVLTTRHVAEGSQVLADGRTMFLVAQGDVNAPAGETAESTAERAVATLQRVIAERDEQRDPVALARGLGWAVVATLVAFLLLRFLFALDRRLGLAFSRRVAERVGEVKVSGLSMFDRAYMLRLVRQLARGIAYVLSGIVLYLWLNAVLEAIPYTRPWGEQLTRVLVDVLEAIGKGILDALPGLIVVVLVFAAARLVTQVVDLFFDQLATGDARVGWLDRHTARPTRILLTLLIWVFAIAMAYPYLPGSDSRAFQGLSVLVGLMVSFGASSIVGQAAAGLILMYTSTFRVGEYVRVQDTEGTITELGVFATRMRTGRGDEVVLPNNLVLGNVATNFSREGLEPGFVVAAQVSVGYDTPWRQVHAILEEAARRTPDLQSVPPPQVFQTKLADFYIVYQLSVVCGLAEPLARARLLSTLHGNILDAFNEHGVQLMSPHYLGDPERPKVVPKSAWFKPPAA